MTCCSEKRARKVFKNEKLDILTLLKYLEQCPPVFGNFWGNDKFGGLDRAEIHSVI